MDAAENDEPLEQGNVAGSGSLAGEISRADTEALFTMRRRYIVLGID